MKIHTALLLLPLIVSMPAFAADVPVPVATDSRIKTYVYSENDVFAVVTHYGFQSNIEFSPTEEIETISVGDRVGWQIVPAGRRIFIRALATSVRTNMTVVTNKHAYQFDLISAAKPVMPREELVYVVRFFYPDARANALPPLAESPEEVTPAEPAAAAAAPASPATPTGGLIYNYNYTYTGDTALAPIRLFDDGHSTYFKFRPQASAPMIATVSDGKESAVTPRQQGEYWVVDAVAARFVLRKDKAVVCVYNEKLHH